MVEMGEREQREKREIQEYCQLEELPEREVAVCFADEGQEA